MPRPPQGHGGVSGLVGHRSVPRSPRSAGRPAQPLRSGEQLPAAAQHPQDQEEPAGQTLKLIVRSQPGHIKLSQNILRAICRILSAERLSLQDRFQEDPVHMAMIISRNLKEEQKILDSAKSAEVKAAAQSRTELIFSRNFQNGFFFFIFHLFFNRAR